MAPSRKRVSIGNVLGETEVFLRDILYDQPRAWLIQAREKARDLPKTNFELGCRFADIGKWYDAMFRFRVTLYLQPNYPQALYNLGCCYFHLGRTDKAVATFKQVLAKTPNHADVIFMLAAIDPTALTPAQRPQRMPRTMVTGFFTSIAGTYNAVEAQNQYRGGAVVAEQAKPLLPPSGLTVVDLGCGTGLAAMPFRANASVMTGVEITPAMAAQAAAATQNNTLLFDRVITADMTALDDQIAPETADLMLLVNVVQFVGGLDTVMASSARLLKPGGLLALTVEPFAAADGFGVVAKTGRFGHGAVYVTRLAEQNGLRCLKQSNITLYPQTNAALFLLRKGGE